jgi:Mn-dependent DtxR family transcriptional regulator
MQGNDEFRTVRGYQLLRQRGQALSPSMEDYLEMIYRLCREDDYARVNVLADKLNVRAPSVSRVLRKLAEYGYVKFHPYGIIQLTDEGRALGALLLRRHETVATFLRTLGVEECLLKETELIEHHLSDHTVELLDLLNAFHAAHPDVLENFVRFKSQQKDCLPVR